MELELQSDLIEALEGIDPSEFLIDDPLLAAIANDINCDGSGLTLKDNLVNGETAKQANVKKRYNKSDDKSYICVVCGASAKGFYYYGAIVCSSCRAFFKRSIQGESYKDFLCQQGDGECKIDSKLWHRCRLCRFNLCLKQDMIIPGTTKNSSATSGEEGRQGREALRTYLMGCMEETFSNRFKNLLSPLYLSEMMEMSALKKILQIHPNVENRVLQTFLKDDLTYLYQMTEFSFLGKPSPIYMNKGVEDYIMLCGSESLIKFARELRDNVASKDHSRLAKSNTPLILEYLAASRIGTVLHPVAEQARHYENLLRDEPDKETARRMYKIHSKVF